MNLTPLIRWTTTLLLASLALGAAGAAGAAGGGASNGDIGNPQAEVRAAETAFAQAMADRDFAAFGRFVADEAIFFGGDGEMRGKAAVLEGWKPLFDGPRAPFSWAPKDVVVLDSGGLALSSGPVHAPDGRQVGSFNSVWRRESPGVWRVVFDKGCDACPRCPATPAP